MKNKLLLLLIIILAFSLRIYKVDIFPATLYGDEQAFAWNAYNILLTGQDEYGTPYPLQFRSFEDYKAPIPVYLLVPFIKAFGLDPYAIRLPIVIASTMTVLVTYFLARLFFQKKISLIITFLLAVSPWHIHLSRGFIEAILALLWFILGIYLFLKSDNRFKIIILSMVFFGLSIYSYFTPRILVPIFIMFLIIFKKTYRNNNYLFGLILLIIISLPLIRVTLLDKGFSRFSKLTESMNTIVKETVNRERNASNLPLNWRVIFHNKATVWMRLVKNNYLEHLSANFWYIYGDNSLRYFTGNMGMFYLLEFPFIIGGLYFLWKEKRKTAVFFLGWILLSPIPASLVGRPFAVRSLAMLPAPFVFTGYGIYKVYSSLINIKWKYIFLSVMVFGYILSIGTLLIRYYLEYPVYAATWWGWENKAAIDYVKTRESDYDQIFLSDFYTGMPLAFAVYNRINPLVYRQAVNNPVVMADGRHLIKFGKYYIGSLDIDKNRLIQGVIPPGSLYLARPEEADGGETINSPDDGRVIFKIYKTK